MFLRMLIGVLWCTGISYAHDRVVVDKVLAILYHQGGPTLILQSHLRPDLTDAVPTLKEVILKKLVLQRAKQLKIPLSESDKERHLARAQEQLGMTREEITAFFSNRGLTLEEAREQLGEMLLIEMTIDHVVRSKAYISNSEVEAYHKNNPLVFYEIKQALIPFGTGSKSLQRALLLRDIEQSPKDLLEKYSWSTPITIKGSDIAQEKSHITTAAPGALVLGQETSEGITLVQLVSKKEVPLSERKQEISALLGKDRYKVALDEFYDTLFKEAGPSIRYIGKQDTSGEIKPAF